jgi:hypothetical protein
VTIVTEAPTRQARLIAPLVPPLILTALARLPKVRATKIVATVSLKLRADWPVGFLLPLSRSRAPPFSDDSCLRHPREDVLVAVLAAVKFSAMRRKWRLLRSLRIMRVYFRTPDGCSGWPMGSKVGWRNSECYGQPDAP